MVTFSSQLCAASRALETSLPPPLRLFTDPYAELLAGPEALSRMRARLAGVLHLAIPARPRIAIRTRYFDDFANSALHRLAPSKAQLVSLAAGLETRAFRLCELSDQVALFEVDRQEVLDRKERLLAEVEPRPQVRAGSRTVVDADLAEAHWTRKIEEAGFDRAVKTVWLLEGLLYYLEEERVTQLLREVWEISAEGSCVCFSVVTGLAKHYKKSDTLANYFKSAMPDPASVLNEAGWSLDVVDQLGGPNANYGRWQTPETIGPDDWRSTRATIYVSATKRR